ncbi:MAG: ATP-dependent DNA helicase RecG, partial [Gammaproteobacteria bacterium]|nr:ATP-dependent DNA helicase RecG [Gammaproteobacteria bacterium]
MKLLKGAGPATCAKLARLGIERVSDLLFHLPLRYQDRTRITPISDLRDGEEAQIVATVNHTQIQSSGRRSLIIDLTDATGQLRLRFFHFNPAQQRQLSVGSRLCCYGLVRIFAYGPEIAHPDYRIITDEELVEVEPSLTPIYPTTAALNQKKLSALIAQALALAAEPALLPELLPQPLHRLLPDDTPPSLLDCLQLIHHPPPGIDAATLAHFHHPAQQRLIFEELLAHRLSLRRLRQLKERQQAPQLERAVAAKVLEQYLAALPFQLTPAQQRVAAEVSDDLRQQRPMQRLVQGDVGSGKTVIAALAALQAVANGWQCALMAPTELLAEQHFITLKQWVEPLGIAILRLSGEQKRAVRRPLLAAILEGEADLIVGTHALFQQEVTFARLGLVIIDEQHRFGVHQRLSLHQKGGDGASSPLPHQLTMTATPIPRSLAMTAYADLDLSTIDALPPGRQPVTTVVLSESRRDEVLQRVRLACLRGEQAYWVCPLISESEKLQCQAAEESWSRFCQLLPDIKIALIHGRLDAETKGEVMAQFQRGEVQLLVATTVIEVGVDVTNATLMIIENAERLGLAQLHQLRGRVGRGERQSHCILLYRPPLSENSHRRLTVMRESQDGFVISEQDLKIRGPGELLGTRQTGSVPMRIAKLPRDEGLLPAVAAACEQLLAESPQWVQP